MTLPFLNCSSQDSGCHGGGGANGHSSSNGSSSLNTTASSSGGGSAAAAMSLKRRSLGSELGGVSVSNGVGGGNDFETSVDSDFYYVDKKLKDIR